MASFVLIDPSLGGIGGHHYDYAVQVLTAAAEMGFRTYAAANRRFRKRSDFPADCRCLSLFRYHTYSKYTIFAGTHRRVIDALSDAAEAPTPDHSLRGLLRDLWRRLDDLRHRNGPQRRIDDMTSGCRRLFQEVELQAGDHVFVPTLSELDFAALAEYWRCDPRTRRADWHLQFHYNIFDGREPDYVRQFRRMEELKRHLQRTLRTVGKHRLHFYNTTEQLAAQYNLTGVAEFHALPYPVNPQMFSRGTGRSEFGPLRVTCAGGMRAEKKFDDLSGIVRELWADQLSPGKLQILVQSKCCRMSRRPRLMLPVPPEAETDRCIARPDVTHRQAVVYVKYPLGVDDYTALIRRADVGLFLYDSDRYYVRRAGIMGEYLSAGVPVIVPAGCWLSEQIAEPIFRQQDWLADNLPQVGEITPREMAWLGLEPSETRSGLAFGGTAASGEFEIPCDATELLVGFRRTQPTGPGAYVRLEAESLDEMGELIRRQTHIIGRRKSGGASTALFRLPEEARRMRLSWSNAYHKGVVTVADVSLRFYTSASFASGICPEGAVGLIAASPAEVPDLLRDMQRNYSHYRNTAEDFSRRWNQYHDPKRTIGALLACAEDESPRRLERAA